VNSTRANLTYIVFLLETNSEDLGPLSFGPFQIKEENVCSEVLTDVGVRVLSVSVVSLFGLLFGSEDDGDKFFRNISLSLNGPHGVISQNINALHNYCSENLKKL
jgi:hypothetical protein